MLLSCLGAARIRHPTTEPGSYLQAGAQAAAEKAAAAKAAAAAAREDLEAAREVISSLTNQLAVADQSAAQVRL